MPNVAKTKLLVLSRSRSQVPVNITIDDHPIPPSDTVKYLGVVLRSDLKWSSHIEATSKKAKQHLGLIHRTLHQAPPRVRYQVYRSVTLPKLDYCGAVWDPYLSKDINSLDSVHKFAARVVTNKWKENYADLLNSLQWNTLKTRQTLQKLKLCYRIVNNQSILPANTFLPHPYPNSRTHHTKALFKPFASTTAFKKSCYISTVPLWNSLLQNVIDSPSVF